MNIDLRIPIGLFFGAIGLIMIVFGLTSDPAIYAKSLGINVNLYWGIVELIFGSLMLIFGFRHREPEAAGAPAVAEPVVVISRHDLPPPPTPKREPPVQHV